MPRTLRCEGSLNTQTVLEAKSDLLELVLQFLLVAEGKLFPQCVLFQLASH